MIFMNGNQYDLIYCEPERNSCSLRTSGKLTNLRRTPLDGRRDDLVEVEGSAAEVDLPVLRYRGKSSASFVSTRALRKKRTTYEVVLSATDRLLGALNTTRVGHRNRDAVESEETIGVRKG